MEKEISNVLETIAKPTVEKNLISLCLQNPNLLIDIKDNEVNAEMFLIEANRIVFMAIDYLFYKKQEPTPFAIMEVISDHNMKKIVEDFGGAEYLGVLKTMRTSENNLNIFCEKLKQAYTRYRLCGICDDTKSYLLSDKAEILNPSEIIGSHEERVMTLSNSIQHTKEIYKMGDDVESILEERASNPNRIPGLEVGWNKFDYYTNGGQPGDLIMVCARAKCGKSAILTNWAVKLAIKDQLPILYFDTEMNRREQEDRILSILSGVPHKEIVSGMYMLDTEFGRADDKKTALKKAVEELKQGNYYHVYLPNFSIDKVNAISKKFKLQHDIQAIFFDYLKFPSSQINGLKSVQEWQMLGYLASGLKDLAGILNIPIYSACQENRSDPKGNKKDETNVGGSDRILQLASKLMFLYNKSDEDIMKEGGLNGNQILYIAFQRNAECDCPPIDVQFNRTTVTQTEI